MMRMTGPRVLIAVLAVFYGVFVWWYGGAGKPLTPEETAHYFALLDGRIHSHPNPSLRAAMETLARNDDGREFFMVNLIDDPEDPEAAAAYNRLIIPELLKRGGIPVFLARPFGRFMEPEGLEGWDQVAIVRYRSFRDLLEMITSERAQEIEELKAGSVSKTHVFPTHVQFSFIWVRFIVAVLLVALGLALHLALRRFAFYARN
jgi:hypothetical protein